MANEVMDFFSSVSLFSETDILFSICLTIISVGLIVDIILSIVLVDYNIYKRVWYIFLSVGISLFYAGFYGLEKWWIVKLFCLLSLSVLGVIPIVFIREKKAKEESDLIKYIDSEIRKKEEKEIKEERIQVTPVIEQEVKCSIDFSHIKGVIERVNYYDISMGDRRQIKELESLIYRAENGEEGQEIKEKINDGLGALLKIMAKYGV